MKKNRLDATIFIIIIFLAGLINLFNPNKPTISVAENRKLQEKPVFSIESVFNGSYAKEYSSYYSDTFILRELLMQSKRQISKSFALIKDMKIVIEQPQASTSPSFQPSNTPHQSQLPELSPDISPVPSSSGTPLPSPTPSEEPITEPEYRNVNTVEVLNTPFLLVDNHVVATIWASDESLRKYAQFLNELKISMGEDVSIYSMTVPTSIEYFDLSSLPNITGSQKKIVDDISSYTDSSIKDVDVYSALFNHCSEYIYYKTDHHWTHLGAYYAYTALMESMNKAESIIPLGDYTEKEIIEGYIGSAYRKTNQDERVLNNLDILTAYYPVIDYKFIMHKKDEQIEKRLNDLSYISSDNQYYNMFMSGGNGIYHEFTTTNKNGQTLLLICDSYGASFVHFLLPHYEKVYIMDTRYYDKEYLNGMTIDEFAKSINATDISTLMYMDSVAYLFNTEVLYSLLK